MPREALLLSIRPKFASQILDGSKTVELRRVRPHVRTGQRVLIYGSFPTMALLGVAEVQDVLTSRPAKMWSKVGRLAGVTREEFTEYFRGARRAVAIRLRCVRAFSRPVGLSSLRERWPWFRPPQSYCYVRMSVENSRPRLRSLAPRRGQ